MNKALKILCVHQGSELYGSDRMFIQSVKAFRQKYPEAFITVHIPENGLITDKLRPWANSIQTGDLFVLRRARFSLRYWKNLVLLPRCFLKAWQNMNSSDLIYINTVMIWGYILPLRFIRKSKIIHAHEYTGGPIGYLLKKALSFSKAAVIANSDATATAYDRAYTVWNGLPASVQNTNKAAENGNLRLLLSGRINGWKGHELAVDAMSALKKDGFHDVYLDILGDVFDDQNRYADNLRTKIKNEKLEENITLHGFNENTEPYLQAADVVLVPSTRPEPFGLVAVEAMMRSLPVIAANHGGLREIVVHNETGLLAQPNDAKAWAEAIRKYIVHPSVRIQHGKAGYLRYHELFTEERYFQRFIQAVEKHVA